MADRYIPEHRRTTFKAKNTFKPDELRRRREEQQVEIRKAKREENLAKRRGIARDGDAPGASLGAAPDSDDEGLNTEAQVRSGSPSPHQQIINEALVIARTRVWRLLESSQSHSCLRSPTCGQRPSWRFDVVEHCRTDFGALHSSTRISPKWSKASSRSR